MSGARSSLCLLLIGLALPGAARANGAFPDEFSVHFPAAAPNRIIIGANFGMMVSEDRGATWRYVCEPFVTEDSSDPLALINVKFYQAGAADGEVFQVATNFKVRRTADDGCSWTTAGGAIATLNAVDVFPSPTDPQFVVAIAVNPSGAGSSLVASHDGGATFDSTLISDPNLFASVEVSAGATAGTGTIYATVSGPGIAKLLRSDDLGATWPKSSSYDLPALANGTAQVARIVAIDPEDASTVYLRLLSPPYDAIAIATSGGQSSAVALSVNGSSFTAFARGTDKTLYAGTSDGKLYIRPPGVTAFNAPISGPHFRCLGQRFGNTTDLYACGDMFQDGFSVGVSHDKGQTFQKVMKLSDLQGTLTCPAVQTKCAAHWARIQSVFATDGGTITPDGGSGQQPGTKGGSCSTTGAASFVALALLAAALRQRGRRAS